MVFYDAGSAVFRTFKLRGKKPSCEICGENPSIVELLSDYGDFCGAPAHDNTKSGPDGSAEKSVKNKIIMLILN